MNELECHHCKCGKTIDISWAMCHPCAEKRVKELEEQLAEKIRILDVRAKELIHYCKRTSELEKQLDNLLGNKNSKWVNSELKRSEKSEEELRIILSANQTLHIEWNNMQDKYIEERRKVEELEKQLAEKERLLPSKELQEINKELTYQINQLKAKLATLQCYEPSIEEKKEAIERCFDQTPSCPHCKGTGESYHTGPGGSTYTTRCQFCDQTPPPKIVDENGVEQEIVSYTWEVDEEGKLKESAEFKPKKSCDDSDYWRFFVCDKQNECIEHNHHCEYCREYDRFKPKKSCDNWEGK